MVVLGLSWGTPTHHASQSSRRANCWRDGAVVPLLPLPTPRLAWRQPARSFTTIIICICIMVPRLCLATTRRQGRMHNSSRVVFWRSRRCLGLLAGPWLLDHHAAATQGLVATCINPPSASGCWYTSPTYRRTAASVTGSRCAWGTLAPGGRASCRLAGGGSRRVIPPSPASGAPHARRRPFCTTQATRLPGGGAAEQRQ